MGASASSAAAVRTWTADDVATRVSALGAAFAKYEAPIKENGVDGEVLLILEPEALKEHVSSAMQLTKLTVELRKVKRLLDTEARQKQQAKERERQRQEQEAKANEEEELSKVGGPMVEWLVSINVGGAHGTQVCSSDEGDGLH